MAIFHISLGRTRMVWETQTVRVEAETQEEALAQAWRHEAEDDWEQEDDEVTSVTVQPEGAQMDLSGDGTL